MEEALFSLAWARMPLPKEELSKIEQNHRVRPYLLCLDMGNYYYAFPCTSHVYDNNIRYENEKVIIYGSKNTLVKLGELVKLPKKNLEGFKMHVDPKYENEIIKKIIANAFYSEYPKEFMSFIGNQPYYCEIGDMIEIDGQLFIIVGGKEDLSVFPVYTFPVDGSVEIEVDGLKYYVNVFNIQHIKKDADYVYVTHPNIVQNKKGLLKYFLEAPVIHEEKDYKKFGSLEPGMIIEYEYNEYINRMIILENNGYDLEVIVGDVDQIYRDFQPMNLPSDIEFDYRVVGYLRKDRLEKLNEMKNEKLYDDLILRRE